MLAEAVPVRDHGLLGGLTDDDHVGYALLAGRSGGQVLKGGTASGDDLTLQSTNHATRGDILFDTFMTLGSDGFLSLGATPSVNKFFNASHTFSGTGQNYGAIIQSTLDTAQTWNIGLGTIAATTHTSGTVTSNLGYFGGATMTSNSAVIQAVGLYAQTVGGAGSTAAVTYMEGLRASFAVEDTAVTFGFCIRAAAPSKDTGTVTHAISGYFEDPTIGTNNWAGMFLGDVQISSGRRLILEGSLGVKGDTYIVYQNSRFEFFLNGTLEGYVDTTGFVSV